MESFSTTMRLDLKLHIEFVLGKENLSEELTLIIILDSYSVIRVR